MKYSHSSLLFTGVLVVLSSCATSKLLKSHVRPKEVTDLQYIQPLSYISLVEPGKKMKLNDSISQRSVQVLKKVIEDHKNMIPVTGMLSVADSQKRKILEEEIKFLCFTAERKKNISNLIIPPMIDSLLESDGKRFGLITITEGFIMSKKSYKDQKAQAIGIAILSLGAYSSMPMKSSSTLYVMIVDAKQNNIAFFRKSFIEEKSPLKEAGFIELLDKIFEGYYWIKN